MKSKSLVKIVYERRDYPGNGKTVARLCDYYETHDIEYAVKLFAANRGTAYNTIVLVELIR